MSASFTHDGDGARVNSVLNGVTTDDIGTHLEWTGSRHTSPERREAH